jgi:hypothetical protein
MNMYNSEMPSRADQPSTRQLIRSTLIAAVSALVLLFTVVLPSEYGVDPSGIGRALGLTEMGEIKTRLAREAAKDATATQAPHSEPAAAKAAASNAGASIGPAWRDEMTFTLTPGQGTEVKLKMMEGDKAQYAWSVQGGVVNFDTHGDGTGRSVSYEKGRRVANDEGELIAAFTGNHGWYWRNRGEANVTVLLRTGGAYSDIKRVK